MSLWFFRPRPPLLPSQRAELELLSRKLVSRIGEQTIRAARVVEDVGVVPLDMRSDRTLLQSAADYVATIYAIAPGVIEVTVAGERAMPEAWGKYHPGSRPRVEIREDVLRNPLDTLVVVAHEFAHHLLIDQDRDKRPDFDERSTDLIAVLYGLGILFADACFRDRNWSDGTWNYSIVAKSGYLTSAEIGFGLALFCRLRRELNPSWKSRVRLDARVPMQQMLKWMGGYPPLGRTLLLDARSIPDYTKSRQELVRWLAGPDQAFAIAAAWQLVANAEDDTTLKGPARKLLRASDPVATRLAIAILLNVAMREFPAARAETTALLKKLFVHRDAKVALHAIDAVREIEGTSYDLIDAVEEVCRRERLPEGALAETVSRFGPDAKPLAGDIVRRLRQQTIECDEEGEVALARCLSTIHPYPAQLIKNKVNDPELRSRMLARLSGESTLNAEFL